jgi:uncharacterized integral membrane protein (TIGR00697 family)
MNEILFLCQLIVVVGTTLGALRAGKVALTGWMVLLGIFANFFVLKQMTLFGFEVTCSDVFAVGSLAGLNLIQEYFGKENAKRAIWFSFAGMGAFLLLSQLHLAYRPSTHDTGQGAYELLLNPAPRLLIASVASFFTVQLIDLKVFAFIKRYAPRAPRQLLCLMTSQIFDTVLFSFLGLWGIVASISDVIILSTCVKLAVVACAVPLLTLSKKIVRHEQLQV